MTNNLLKTIAFFDIFNYPLTPWELWRFSQIKQSYEATLEAIKETGLPEQNGFYFLPEPERELTIITRQERYNIADKKFQRARKFAWLISHLPWIKLVALVNLIGAHNLRAEGDLDFFIVVKKNRLWLSRLFIATVLKIFKLRPTAKKSRDTICLSFWVDEEHLDLSAWRLNDDWYFRYWLACITPLYDKNQTYKKLIKTNSWLSQELPNWQPANISSRRSLKKAYHNNHLKAISHPMRGVRNNNSSVIPSEVEGSLQGGVVNKLEKLAKNFQWKIMPANLKTLANQNTRVVINEGVIKMHPVDRRMEFMERWQEKLNDLGNLN